MKILDLTSGNRAIWFNKKHPDCLYLDKREVVKPDIVCNTNELPKEVIEKGPFDLIVFDPPHKNCGPNSNMSKVYGYHTTDEIIKTIALTGHQAYLVSHNKSLMALKWNNADIKLQRVFDLLVDWEPLFGHLTKDGPRSQTYWTMLKRKNGG